MGANESNPGGDQSEMQSEAGVEEIYHDDHYEFISQIDDPRLGDIKILKHKLSDRRLAVKTRQCNSKEDFEEASLQLDQLKQISHPNILKIIDIRSEKDEGFCSQMFIIRTIYEYIEFDLESETFQRVDPETEERQYYEEAEIVHMLQDTISGLQYLKQKEILHGDLTTKNILLTDDIEGNRLHKLHIPAFTNQTNHYIKLMNQVDESVYLSPQLFEQFGNQEISPEADPEKSDIFSMGIIALQASLLEETNSCYDFEDYSIKHEVVQAKLQQIADQYSQTLAEILISFLETDEENRVSYEEALELLSQHPDAKDLDAAIEQNFQQESPQTKKILLGQDSAEKGEGDEEYDEEQQQQNGENQVQDLEQQEDGQQLQQENLEDQQQQLNSQQQQQEENQVFQQSPQINVEEPFEENLKRSGKPQQPQAKAAARQFNNNNDSPNKGKFNSQKQKPSQSSAFNKQKQQQQQQLQQQQQEFPQYVQESAGRQVMGNEQLNNSLKNIDQMVKEALGKSEDTKQRYDSNQQLKSFMRDLLDDEIFVPINPSPSKKSQMSINKSQKYSRSQKPFTTDPWKI